MINMMTASTLIIIKYEFEGSLLDFQPCKNLHDPPGNMAITRVPMTHTARNIVDSAEKIIIPPGDPMTSLFSVFGAS